MLTSLKRVIRTGWEDFSRHMSLSLGAVFVMVIVISLPTFLFIMKPASDILISEIKNKVDISVYFKEDVKPEDVFLVKSAVSKIPTVKEVTYDSKEDVLKKFVERHENDPVLMQSLEEIGLNPFLSSLNIKTLQASQYQQIADFLETGPFKNLIYKVDYRQRKEVIERIFSTISAVNKIGIFFSLILGIVAVLLAFNAVKTAIGNAKEEIGVMRLVGASNWFIRGPFMTQGVIIGLTAGLITFFFSFIFCWVLDSKVKLIAPQISLSGIFTDNLAVLILIQLASGVGLGAVSSLIAIRKHLKI
jgi:cell division transport system permease protein